jgi:hypothetical protein
MSTKRFCYVAQGRVSDIDKLEAIFTGRTLLALTWDQPRDGAIFLPKSSWSEGRRALCHAALQSGEHDYIVFMDGDAITTPAELAAFEQTVTELRPAVAVPRVPKTERYTQKLGETPPRWVLAYDSDEQFQCFDVRVLRQHLGGSPYVSEYDKVSWWYPCVLNQKLIRKHYWRSFIQVNLISVGNDSHGSYPNTFDPDYIHKEVERLGVSTSLPLSAGGRFSARPRLDKRMVSLDKRLFVLLSHFSRLLYKPFDPQAPAPHLSTELKAMIR